MFEPPARLDPADPKHLDFLHRKMLYAVDERPVLWWKTGTKYGVIEGNVTPMWNMWVFFVQRVVEHRDTSFDVASLEAVYLTDMDTGDLCSIRMTWIQSLSWRRTRQKCLWCVRRRTARTHHTMAQPESLFCPAS